VKNRKNETKPQSSQQPLGEPNRILFLCDYSEGRLAQVLFDIEARKLEVYWLASSACLTAGVTSDTSASVVDVVHTAIDSISDISNDCSSTALEALRKLGIETESLFKQPVSQVTAADIQKANMVVLIERVNSSESNDSFKKQFQSLRIEPEIWQVPSDNNPVDSLMESIKALLIRLILKGGKRAPVPIEVSVARPTINPSGGKSSVRVRLESKGRRGKKVTVIFGLDLEGSDLEKLATELKQTCGTGGSVKDGTIEIQGDQCDRVLLELKNRGLQAKRSGG
jgi:translation initiation factor 1